MMAVFLLIAACFTAAWFGIRLYMLKKALKETSRELSEIRQDISQNQILRLPSPDSELEQLMRSINGILDEIRNERMKYAERERKFQSQIEAISHDLRTPLTVILGYMKFLQMQEQDLPYTKEQREMLDGIGRKARAMETLISQFYDYSRLSAGDYELRLEEIDAGRILIETFADNCRLLEAARLEVKTDFPDHPVWVRGEEAALERVFSNLLQNAERYAHSYLHIAIRENDGEAWVYFENDTRKASPADLPRLFERFYRKDSSRNQGGTGLGLTIAKYLAEEMNGGLTAEIMESHDSSSWLFRLVLCLKTTR